MSKKKEPRDSQKEQDAKSPKSGSPHDRAANLLPANVMDSLAEMLKKRAQEEKQKAAVANREKEEAEMLDLEKRLARLNESVVLKSEEGRSQPSTEFAGTVAQLPEEEGKLGFASLLDQSLSNEPSVTSPVVWSIGKAPITDVAKILNKKGFLPRHNFGSSNGAEAAKKGFGLILKEEAQCILNDYRKGEKNDLEALVLVLFRDASNTQKQDEFLRDKVKQELLTKLERVAEGRSSGLLVSRGKKNHEAEKMLRKAVEEVHKQELKAIPEPLATASKFEPKKVKTETPDATPKAKQSPVFTELDTNAERKPSSCRPEAIRGKPKRSEKETGQSSPHDYSKDPKRGVGLFSPERMEEKRRRKEAAKKQSSESSDADNPSPESPK